MKRKLIIFGTIILFLIVIFLLENHSVAPKWEENSNEVSYAEQGVIKDEKLPEEKLAINENEQEDGVETQQDEISEEYLEESSKANQDEDTVTNQEENTIVDNHEDDKLFLSDDIEDITENDQEEIVEEIDHQDFLIDEIIPDEQNTIFLSVSCHTVFQNKEKAKQNVWEAIPQSGVILAEARVSFEEGESAFDVLKRELIARNIHMEFNYTPVYNSIYIEGIGNLYEFDFGELSGWIYKVNGVAPNYASSSYLLKPGDRVEFVDSCDLGNDV